MKKFMWGRLYNFCSDNGKVYLKMVRKARNKIYKYAFSLEDMGMLGQLRIQKIKPDSFDNAKEVFEKAFLCHDGTISQQLLSKATNQLKESAKRSAFIHQPISEGYSKA